ncbi:hypothetical protein SEA_WARREN_36 [Microbacterium phage Warren]|nr:hypothetical protein SEA_WARREN_36 [Microbacterium phage Warren]
MSAVEFMLLAAIIIGVVLAHVLGGNLIAALGIAALLWIVYALVARIQDRDDA